MIAADHWPGSGPPIVLAHGGGQTRHSWGATAAALAERGHRVLSVDLRGHGDSAWAPDGEYAMADFVTDHLATIEWIGEPVIWIGASLGGSSGLMAVGHDAAAFSALVLVDITPSPAAAGVDRILAFMAETSIHGFADLDEAADAVEAYQPHRKRPQNTSGLAKNLRRGDDGRWRWHWDPAFVTSPKSMTNERGRHGEAEGIARSLRLPTMLVRGRLSDLVTETEAEAFLEMAPHAEYVDVANAAHMIAGDKNDAFMSAIVNFVSRLETPDGPSSGA
jgi:pimeloyl-ACP methyl ester carboxylesterase